MDYWNNFVTLYAFAEHYDLDDSDAEIIIEKGRQLQDGA